MKLRFSIRYRTAWGESLHVVLQMHRQDGTVKTQNLQMQTEDGEQWTLETVAMMSRQHPVSHLVYHYQVENGDGDVLRQEWDGVPRIYHFDASQDYIFPDQWKDRPLNSHLYSDAYLTTLKARLSEQTEPVRLPLFRKTVIFRVSAPQLKPGQAVAVCGSHPAIGSWNPSRYVLMQSIGQHEWMLSVNVQGWLLPVEYKYVVIDQPTHTLLEWEGGENRLVAPVSYADGTPPEIADGQVLVLYGDALRICEEPWRLAGVCVPVFALRSEYSYGVGDFGDLKRLVDWALATGMKVIQVLPVNDTTHSHWWGDSNPYKVTNALALHPHYVDLEAAGTLRSKEKMTKFLRRRQELNNLPYSDYEAVDRVKTEYLQELYEEQGKKVGDFDTFVQSLLHKQLKEAADYARSKGVVLMGDLPISVSDEGVEVSKHLAQYFDAMRLDHAVGYFRMWEKPQDAVSEVLGHYVPALPLTVNEIEYFGLPFRKELMTKPFVNDHLIDRIFGMHAQYVREHFLVHKAYNFYDLKEEYCTQRKVMDAFEGRNDENSLWIRDGLMRLIGNVLFVEDVHQAEMYHPRIDVLKEPVFEALSAEEKDAFQRIYNNYYGERHSFFWGQQALRRLPKLMNATRMLFCADDVGQMPDCVAPVLDQLRILTTEIQQLPKEYGFEYGHLEANPLRSLCTISTHHMAPLRLWWQENPEKRQRYYVTMLQKEGRAPEQLPVHLAEEIIARHLYCPSMLCVLQLQDWLAMDSELRCKQPQQERVNNPSDPDNRWQYRMHLTIEQLLDASRFNNKVRTMIQRSRR